MLAFIYTLVPWIGPILGIVGSRMEGMSVLEFFQTPDGAGMGFFGLAATVIVLGVTFFGAIEEIDSNFLFSIAGLGVVADIACLILPYREQIVRWCETDGKNQIPVYLGILVVVVLLNLKSHRVKKKLGDAAPPTLMLPVVLYLIIPSLIIYIYDGLTMEKYMDRLVPNLDIMSWNWTAKISLVMFLLHILKYFLPALWQRDPLYWVGAAHFGNVLVICFLYVLLERSLFPISHQGLSTTILLFIPMTLVPGFFHFYSYLAFLHGLIEFFAPGAIKAWRLQKEEEAREEALSGAAGEREALEEALDSRERAFNALTGDGPYTDAEALARGKLSTNEYAARELLREEARDKKR